MCTLVTEATIWTHLLVVHVHEVTLKTQIVLQFDRRRRRENLMLMWKERSLTQPAILSKRPACFQAPFCLDNWWNLDWQFKMKQDLVVFSCCCLWMLLVCLVSGVLVLVLPNHRLLNTLRIMNWMIFVSTPLNSASHWKLAKSFCFTWGQWKAAVGFSLCKKKGRTFNKDHIHFSSTHTVSAMLNLAPRWFSLTFTASFSAPHKAAALAASVLQLHFSRHWLV